jgi:hypothetical protein
MLIQPDINELGDKRLDQKEGVASMREKCISMSANRRLPHQEDLEDPDRAFGPRLQYTEFISRLKKIIPSLKVMDGSPGNVALYFPRTAQELEVAKAPWEEDKQSWRRNKFFLRYKYVGGFPKSTLQEYGTVDIDNAMLATKEHRAWRSVLINLIRAGVVNYHTVVKEFGDCGSDRRGWRWREQLRQFKYAN